MARLLHSRFALVALAFWLAACSPGPGVTARPAATLIVGRGDLVVDHVMTGEIVAEDALDLTAPDVPVRPLELRWLAPEGSEVAAGDRLVEFDNSSLLAELADQAAKAAEEAGKLESAEAKAAAEVAAAEIELASRRARREKARLEAEVPPDLLAAREHQERQLELERAALAVREGEGQLTARLEAGRLEVELARLALGEARTKLREMQGNLDRLVLRAPRDGLFLIGFNDRETRPWQVGDAIWPGQTVAQLPDLSSLVVAARLFDVDDGHVRLGLEAELVLDAFPERTYRGEIREIEQIAQLAQRDQTRRSFGVVSTIGELDVELVRPGMSVRVVVAEPRCTGCLLVPRPAIDWTDSAGPRVRRAGGGFVAVVLGPCNTEFCVAESGLPPGERLVPAEAER